MSNYNRENNSDKIKLLNVAVVEDKCNVIIPKLPVILIKHIMNTTSSLYV